MPTYSTPRRGEVWSVTLDPTVGHEVRKTRPAVVISSDAYNEENWVVTVLPLTSRSSAAYDQVLIDTPEGGLTQASVTLPDQIRSIDRQRLARRLGRLNDTTITKINRSIKVVLGLI